MAMTHKDTLRHVVRAPEVYLIPRSDGRVVIGATVEEAGFNKQTVPATILRLHEAALKLAPELRNGKILEAWAGLRPGTVPAASQARSAAAAASVPRSPAGTVTGVAAPAGR